MIPNHEVAGSNLARHTFINIGLFIFNILLSSADFYLKHRHRLRNRIIESNGKGVNDYELLELLLFGVFKRKDVKPLAKSIIEFSGSFSKVFRIVDCALENIDGVGKSTIAMLICIREIIDRVAYSEMLDKKVVLKNWSELVNYLCISTGFYECETIRILYLNANFTVVKEKFFDYGSVDSISFYDREIIKYALNCSATALVVAHNHPSGVVEPSDADIAATRNLKKACSAVGLNFLDHIIVSGKKFFSFQEKGLMDLLKFD